MISLLKVIISITRINIEPIGSISTTSIAESTKPTGPDTGLDVATFATGDIFALVASSTADSSIWSTGYDTGSNELIETRSTVGVTTIAKLHFDLYLEIINQ